MRVEREVKISERENDGGKETEREQDLQYKCLWSHRGPSIAPHILERVEYFMINLIQITTCLSIITLSFENGIFLTKAKHVILAMWLTELF